MRLDPAVATVLAALITTIGVVLVARFTAESKRREAELAEASAARAAREAEWETVKHSRLVAMEDLALERRLRREAEAHLAVCVAALRIAGIDVPDRPTLT